MPNLQSVMPGTKACNHAIMPPTYQLANMLAGAQARMATMPSRRHATMQANTQPCNHAILSTSKQYATMPAGAQASKQPCNQACIQSVIPGQPGRQAGKQGGKQACCTHACNHASGQARKQPCTHAIKLCNQAMQSSRLASGQAGRQGSNHATMQSFRLPSTQPCNQAMQSNHATKPCKQPCNQTKHPSMVASVHATMQTRKQPWDPGRPLPAQLTAN
jgi:hypothetical protein